MKSLSCLHNQHAIAAKKGAEQVLAWHATITNKDEMSRFAHQLVLTLQSCFKEIAKQKDRREKMFEQLYCLRITNEFTHNWTTFLKKCGVVDPTLYSISAYNRQSIQLFNHS